MSQSIPYFINNHKFDSTLHRLIMCRIWMSGSSDCSGVRYLSVKAFAEFCCCSVSEFYAAVGDLAKNGHVAVVAPSDGARRVLKMSDPLGFVLVPDLQVDSYEAL